MGSLTLPSTGPVYLDTSGFIYSVERIMMMTFGVSRSCPSLSWMTSSETRTKIDSLDGRVAIASRCHAITMASSKSKLTGIRG